MLVNCSNHPSALWGAAQMEAARAYGEVVDLPFPQVDPRLDPEEIRALAGEYRYSDSDTLTLSNYRIAL